MALVRLQSRLIELTECLASVNELTNCHISNFFTKDLWNSALPSKLLQEIENLLFKQDFVTQYMGYISTNQSPWQSSYLNLHELLVNSNDISIRKDITCVTPLHVLLNQLVKTGFHSSSLLRITDFMSEKKKHEVEETIPIVDLLSRMLETTHVVDIGGGKGYLGYYLSVNSNLKVLALDSSTTNTRGAEKLEKKMNKHSRLQSRNCSRETINVCPQTKLMPLIDKNYDDNSPVSLGILGLHTCGNLASTCCQLFLKENASWLVNIGCCYHLIEELYENHSFWKEVDPNTDVGFPVSIFLKQRNFKLGRNARMLAAHSLDKLKCDGPNDKAMESMFYRAILQVIIEKVKGNDVVEGFVGKIYNKTDNFHQYIRKSVQKLQLDIDLSDGDIDEFLTTYSKYKEQFKIFILLRTHFAPLIESVILLDRLLFLQEQGIENSFLVPLFKPEISPRNHAIIAWKTNPTTTNES